MMTNIKNETNFGDNAQVSGTIQQTAAGMIQHSLNHIDRSGIDSELKNQLQVLARAVEEMCKHLPSDQQEEQARNLETLAKEVTAGTPRRQWYELSAAGLIEAAQSVGKIAAPVVTATQAVLKFFK